jgi:SAM-dependent methyltransferase
MVVMKKVLPYIINKIPRPWLIRLSLISMQFVSVFYHGNKVECPVCGGHFRKFLPYGHNKVRDNVLCPKCFSLERHRLLWLFLKNKTGIFTESWRVLHIAPEQCFYKHFRKLENLQYTTADLESPIADVQIDVQSLPFDENTFDVVICNHVMEHVPDDRKAIGEIFRVLKRGGFAILQVPANYSMEETIEDPTITDPVEREKRFRQKDHYRFYGRDYLKKLEDAGFIIREKNYLLDLPREERELYRL